jgi:transposase
MTEQVRFWVGVDWGEQKHQVCVLDAQRVVRLERSVRHAADEIAALADELLKLVGGDPSQLAVGIETPRGAVVETLIERGIAVYAINPKQLDRFRDRHTAAGAKDDRRDAFVAADSLRTDLFSFHRVLLGDPRIVEIRELSRMHDELAAERVMLGNRLRGQIHRYFPQLLELGSLHDSRWLWTLLERAPTPQAARRLSVQTIRSILKQHRIRSSSAEQVREVLEREPLRVAPGVVEAACKHVSLLLPRLRTVHEQQAQVAREIRIQLDALTSSSETEHGSVDARILRSLPGIGPIVCAMFLAEAWQPLAARDEVTLRALCGLAPVTRSSGKSHFVCMRYACNGRLREALHHWVMNAVQLDPRARAHYAELRARGHRHGRAVRGVGDRLLAVLLAMLKTNNAYDPSRRQSPRPLTTVATPALQATL